MVELLIFPVDIRQKMLRSLRQAQNGLQVNYFRGSIRNGGKLLGQTFQVS